MPGGTVALSCACGRGRAPGRMRAPMTVTTVPVVGPTVLLASGRLGRQVSVNRSDRPVYVDREGLPCCAHGERATTIQSWLKHERHFVTGRRRQCARIADRVDRPGHRRRAGRWGGLVLARRPGRCNQWRGLVLVRWPWRHAALAVPARRVCRVRRSGPGPGCSVEVMVHPVRVGCRVPEMRIAHARAELSICAITATG